MLALLLVMKLSLSLRYGLRMYLLILGPKKWTEIAYQQRKKTFPSLQLRHTAGYPNNPRYLHLSLAHKHFIPGLLLKKIENSQEHF